LVIAVEGVDIALENGDVSTMSLGFLSESFQLHRTVDSSLECFLISQAMLEHMKLWGHNSCHSRAASIG